MNAFLKVGLPWAISLGTVFFVGLYLGSEKARETFLTNYNSVHFKDPGEEPSTIISPEKLQTASKPVLKKALPATPSMPPNLLRIMQGGDIVERLGSYLDAVRSMDRSNVKQVVKAFEELPSGYGRHLEMKLLMRSWANFDPKAALSYALNSLDARSERKFGISEALAGWVVKDEKAAIEWAYANNPGNETMDNPLLVGIVKGLMETNLDAANRLFLSLPQGNTRWQASSLLAEKYSEEGVKSAIKWAQVYPSDDPGMRESMLGQIGAKIARIDLEATADWANNMENEPGTFRVLENLIHEWTKKAPDAAATWVNSLSDPQKKLHAMNELTRKWSAVDPVATAEWLNTQPPSSQTDPAIATFVSSIRGQDPQGAINWAMSITDENLRQKNVDETLRSWQRKDPEKAEEWIKKNALEN